MSQDPKFCCLYGKGQRAWNNNEAFPDAQGGKCQRSGGDEGNMEGIDAMQGECGQSFKLDACV